ncbi:cytochrome P450 [Mycobacterium avium]|jgi:cytochrome P450|uniref:cytochrome P450 n=1 Tax=Mycobacterium avium TaxID=1764 RepID=UPI0004A103B2|nr:cytochrome P450 [Mycobacterium avium]KDP07005.1 cytochrome P450 [Mycobacterium avium subsp. hominissuis 101]MBZ4507924.1 cytochrome P450 [Mycobacterium avium subsp. hominissuis]MBZ4517829.1 cytochrome P450 [Mycobacterium avium subsp. hominissuis]MBZ4527698.1 cytochrome P450 [Mycobacterium avium subsp. hominissuis]MBZ4546907.1 cytochrome P450 [Mycobacterium avium subsp. hominissuis]
MTNLSVNGTANINDLPFAEDRSRAWRELREAGEAVLSGEEIVLTSAEAVEFAAKRPDIFSSAKAFDRLGSPVPLIPIAIDPPDHTRFRRMLDPFFSPKKMAEREPELRKQAGELIDAILAKGHSDVVADLATPFPSQVFLTLFGLPMADRDRLVQWKDSILEFTDPSSTEATPEVLAHAMELFTYLTEHIAARRADTTGSDMLTQLMQNSEEGGMDDNEILGLCFMFVLAGLDTVTSAVGFALAKLAGDPELRRRISNDYSLIPAFIEELLRVDGPVPFAPRVTTQEVEVAGRVVPKDTTVMLSYGSADRDPLRYEDADNVHLDSKAVHFAFGRGPHRCLGSHLARLELRIILEEWHKRIPEYSLADGKDPQMPWPTGTMGLKSVPLTFPT